jgi:hypothetical protein
LPQIAASPCILGWSQPFGLLWGLQRNPYGPCILGWSQFCFAKLLLAPASWAANSGIFRGSCLETSVSKQLY